MPHKCLCLFQASRCRSPDMLLNGLIVGLVTESFVSRTYNHLHATTIFTEPNLTTAYVHMG